MDKTIGQIVGDLVATLFVKGVLDLEEFKNVIGENNFDKLIKEVADNDSKQSSAQSSREI